MRGALSSASLQIFPSSESQNSDYFIVDKWNYWYRKSLKLDVRTLFGKLDERLVLFGTNRSDFSFNLVKSYRLSAPRRDKRNPKESAFGF